MNQTTQNYVKRDYLMKYLAKSMYNFAYIFGSANCENTSSVGTRCRTPTFNALASERRVPPLDEGTSNPPSPVVPGGSIGTGAVISVPFCTNFSIHEICIWINNKPCIRSNSNRCMCTYTCSCKKKGYLVLESKG